MIVTYGLHELAVSLVYYIEKKTSKMVKESKETAKKIQSLQNGNFDT